MVVVIGLQADAAEDEDDVRPDEGEEDGEEELDRFLHAPQVQHREQGERGHLDGQLPDVPGMREVAEDRLASRCDRGGGGEHVIDEERGAADHAGARTEQPRADGVSAASEGEVLDDLRVGGGNDEDRQPRGEREEDRQVLVLPEVLERLFRTVSGRAEPVGAEADPGEESCQRNVLDEPLSNLDAKLREQMRIGRLLTTGDLVALPPLLAFVWRLVRLREALGAGVGAGESMAGTGVVARTSVPRVGQPEVLRYFISDFATLRPSRRQSSTPTPRYQAPVS